MLKIGSFGFGGPLVAIALMREEFVSRQRRLTPERFQEGLGMVKMLPGPVSSLMSLFVGLELHGRLGALLALLCFVFPAFLCMLALSFGEEAIEAVGGRVLLESILRRLSAAVLVVIAVTCVRLFGDSLQASRKEGRGGWRPYVFAAFGAGLGLLHWSEPLILLLVGVIGLIWDWRDWTPRAGRGHDRLAVHPLAIFWAFFVASFTVFGTGYMVLPYLERTLVEQRAWLGSEDFVRSVLYGNLTPGPIVIASTYMGYKMSGFLGAVTSTVGIFAGPAVLIVVFGRTLNRVAQTRAARAFLQGVVPAVAATIFVSLWSIFGAKMEWTYFDILLALATAVACYFKVVVWRIFLLAFVAAAAVTLAAG